MGCVFANEQSLMSNLYLVDLHVYTKLTKDNKTYRTALICFMKDFQKLFFKARAIVVEKQKISVSKVKLVAAEIKELSKHYFPESKFVDLDPLITRRHWHITVKSKEHGDGKLSQAQLYQIRKALSIDTNVISPEDMGRLKIAFSKKKDKRGKSFYLDAIDASLLLMAYLAEEEAIMRAEAARLAKKARLPAFEDVICVSHFDRTPQVKGIVLNRFSGRTTDGQLEKKRKRGGEKTQHNNNNNPKRIKMSDQDSVAHAPLSISPKKRANPFEENNKKKIICTVKTGSGESSSESESASSSSSSSEESESEEEEGSVYSQKSSSEESSSEEEEEESSEEESESAESAESESSEEEED